MANSISSSNKTNKASSMAELMAKQGAPLNILQKGQIVSGTIKKLTPQEILMDIGAKGDALVIEFDKQNLENLLANLKVGDRVNASVISAESEEGFPVVSLRKTLDDIIFKRFEDLSASSQEFEVTLDEHSRGGYMAVTQDGVRGFLPTSQVISNANLSVGDKIKVKILEYDRPKKRVVFSQKATIFVTDAEAIKQLVKSGDIIEAEVAEVVPYGLFVKIEKGDKSIEGFVHISEVSYERVENLAAIYKAGDKIKAQVLELDSANRRVNLSIKKTLADVFANIRTKYKVEDKVKGKVSKVSSRGVTVSIEDGVNGFIPSDKIPADAKALAGKPSGFNIGEAIECVVVDFDDRRRVIVLSPILKAVPIGYR